MTKEYEDLAKKYGFDPCAPTKKEGDKHWRKRVMLEKLRQLLKRAR